MSKHQHSAAAGQKGPQRSIPADHAWLLLLERGYQQIPRRVVISNIMMFQCFNFVGCLRMPSCTTLGLPWVKELTGKRGDRVLESTLRHLGIDPKKLSKCTFPDQPGHAKNKLMPYADAERLQTLLPGLGSATLNPKQEFIQEELAKSFLGFLDLSF